MKTVFGESMKRVFAFFDEVAQVWVAHSEDIVGLNTEAASIEALRARVHEIAIDLMELNAHLIEDKSPQFEFVVSDALATA